VELPGVLSGGKLEIGQINSHFCNLVFHGE
jgi:hypothetical protein